MFEIRTFNFSIKKTTKHAPTMVQFRLAQKADEIILKIRFLPNN